MNLAKKNVVSILICLMCSILCGCVFSLKETQSFSAEELESYNEPTVFSGASDGRYFIALDNPDIYKKPLNLGQWGMVYGWLTSQTLLMRTEDIFEIYEINIYTGEKVKAAYENEKNNP